MQATHPMKTTNKVALARLGTGPSISPSGGRLFRPNQKQIRPFWGELAERGRYERRHFEAKPRPASDLRCTGLMS
jgi:hypothetical protein